MAKATGVTLSEAGEQGVSYRTRTRADRDATQKCYKVASSPTDSAAPAGLNDLPR